MSGRRISFLILDATILLILAARIFGPGDLYDKDQPKTMAATVDVALNNNWVWPRDMLLEPATKPPLYNWIDAAVLKISPSWDEWAFKLPSLIAGLVVMGMIIGMTKRVLREDPDGPLIARLSGAIWIASIPVMKQMYLSRPDMLMTAFLIGAWVFATRALDPFQTGYRKLALGFWLCTAGAALTKGPPAAIALLYVPLAAGLICGKWSLVARIGWWGPPLLAAIVGGWAWAAHQQLPHAFFDVLASEAGSRFTTGGPEGLAKSFWLPASWFALKFLPWSIAVAIAIAFIRPWRMLRHELAAAIIWIALVIIVFSAVPGKRADYILPAYPTAAMLAAYGLVRIVRLVDLPAGVTVALPLVMAAYLAYFEWMRSPEAETNYSRSLVTFAHDVEQIVPAEERLVFLIKGYHPLLSVMNRHEGNRAQPDHLKDGTWVIAPRNSAWKAQIESMTLPDIVQVAPKQLAPGRMALYKIGQGEATVAAAQALLGEQYDWNFPPDRYRASRDPLPVPSSRPSSAPTTRP